jgi:hypothetical protein
MRVERYEESSRRLWDEFIRASKNGTFLFLRDYMDYHRDRFADHSLMVLDDGGAITALLPANAKDNVVASHGGLTYGGFVTDDKMKLPRMLDVFETSLAYLKEQMFQRVVYKCIPHIYHRAPAEEDSYALFLCRASLIRRGALTVVDCSHPLALQERRRRGARKARNSGVTVTRSDRFEEYWPILVERLREAHGVDPVHSLAEIQRLHSRFPDNIKLFAAYHDNAMVAGVIIYETDRVAHAQYIVSNHRSRDLGALDLVFEELLLNYYRDKPYFDFGTSDELDGRRLNQGLIDQKEGCGARVVAHDHYEIDLTTWTPGQLMASLA